MSESIQKDCDILCDMCSEEDRKPARKTCMKCEISMCVQHLQAHLTTPVLLQTHPLTEPMALGENMKCSQHGKLLEYYCLDDMSLVCVSCAIEDQHRLHNMKTFSTAHKELMEKLRAEQQVLQEKTDDDNMSLEKWEQSKKEKLDRSSVRLIEAFTNLRDVSLTSIQSSVSARMVAIRTSRNSMEAAQKEKDTFKFLQMFSQVNQDVEKAKTVDLRKGLEPGSHRDELVEEIRQKGENMMEQSSGFIGSLLMLLDPENHQELTVTGSDLIFEPQSLGPGFSLSKDSRKVFYNSWVGQCSVSLLIRSTQSTPNYQRWIVSLNEESDWMIGLCDKKAVNNPKNGPVYGLSYEGKHLSIVTTEYKDHPDASSSSSGSSGRQKTAQTTEKQYKVCSELLTSVNGDEKDKEVPKLEMVEVFWNFVDSKLSFFRRTGQYQREEMITIDANVNNWDLVPFVRLDNQNTPENSQNIPKKEWLCSCERNNSSNQTSCSRCGKTFHSFITEVACELL